MEVAELEVWQILVRVLVAAALGAAIGLERELSDQPAGFRTHLLVSLGACLFTLVGAYGLHDFQGSGEVIDPTRIAAQVVTGIGFLGAGAILQRGITVRGLTTAAALWVTAALGMAAAFGYWWGAGSVTATALLALYGLKRFEVRIFPRIMKERFHIALEVSSDFELGSLEGIVDAHGARLEKIRVHGMAGRRRHLDAVLILGSEATPSALADELSRSPGIENLDWRS